MISGVFCVLFGRFRTFGACTSKCIPNHVTRGQGCAVIIIATIRNNGFRNNDVAKVRIYLNILANPPMKFINHPQIFLRNISNNTTMATATMVARMRQMYRHL